MGNCPEVGSGVGGSDGCGEAGQAKREKEGESTEAGETQVPLWKQLSQNNEGVGAPTPYTVKNPNRTFDSPQT